MEGNFAQNARSLRHEKPPRVSQLHQLHRCLWNTRQWWSLQRQVLWRCVLNEWDGFYLNSGSWNFTFFFGGGWKTARNVMSDILRIFRGESNLMRENVWHLKSRNFPDFNKCIVWVGVPLPKIWHRITKKCRLFKVYLLSNMVSFWVSMLNLRWCIVYSQNLLGWYSPGAAGFSHHDSTTNILGSKVYDLWLKQMSEGHQASEITTKG